MSINDLTWKDVQNIYIMVNNLTNKLDCDPSLFWEFLGGKDTESKEV